MLVCPLCGQKNELTEAKCTRCGEDLTLYSKVYFAPDVLYNMAVNLAKQGETASAAELLLSANRMKPADTDIINLLVGLYIKLGDNKSALEKCLLLLEINPGDEKANQLLEELSELINIEDEKKKKLQSFLNKSVAQIYSEVSGEKSSDAGDFMLGMKQPAEEASEAAAAEASAVGMDAVDSVNAESLEPDKNHRPDLWSRFVICISVAVLIMLLGFGAVYWKLSDNISVTTNTWAKSTEGQITMIAEDLAGKIKDLQAGQKDLSTKLETNDRDLVQDISTLSDEVKQVGTAASSLSGKFDGSSLTLGEVKTQVEDLNKEMTRLRTKLQQLQEELLQAAVK